MARKIDLLDAATLAAAAWVVAVGLTVVGLLAAVAGLALARR